MFRTPELSISTPHSHLGPASAPQQGSLPAPNVGMGLLLPVTDGFLPGFLGPPSSGWDIFCCCRIEASSPRGCTKLGKKVTRRQNAGSVFGPELKWWSDSACSSHTPLFSLLRVEFEWQKREQTTDLESQVPPSVGKSFTIVLAGDRIRLFSSTVDDTLYFQYFIAFYWLKDFTLIVGNWKLQNIIKKQKQNQKQPCI